MVVIRGNVKRTSQRLRVPIAAGAALLLGLSASRAEAEQIPIAPLKLRIALIEDPDFPPLGDDLLARALESASSAFADRFGVERPAFQLAARFSIDDFMRRYAKADAPQCSALFSAIYRGGGREELAPLRPRAIKFFERWSLDALRAFVEEDRRAAITSYSELYDEYVRRYLATVGNLQTLETPRGTPLIKLGGVHYRSHAAWSCASATQRDFDVLITNTFILADLLTEPHPHTVFGKAKVGGIAGPNPFRKALGGQALVASTFAIDTPIALLSELGGKPATVAERGEILGAYLIAHEIAHAIFGIPDVFDHPEQCLMTSRAGETYREGLAVLEKNPGACPRCRPYVQARSALDRGRALLDRGELTPALSALSKASRLTPKQLHGGYKKRMAEISLMVSEAYLRLGNEARARSFAENAMNLDPRNDAARQQFERWRSEKLKNDLAAADRQIPIATSTKSSARNGGQKHAR